MIGEHTSPAALEQAIGEVCGSVCDDGSRSCDLRSPFHWAVGLPFADRPWSRVVARSQSSAFVWALGLSHAPRGVTQADTTQWTRDVPTCRCGSPHATSSPTSSSLIQLCPSHQRMGLREDAATAEDAAARKRKKYEQVSRAHDASFIPFSLESTRGISKDSCNLPKHIALASHDHLLDPAHTGREHCRALLPSPFTEVMHAVPVF